VSHRRAIARGGAAAWAPPEFESLLIALVSGLSGSVDKLGSWAGQYDTIYAATLYGDAVVTENGLVLDGTGDYASLGTSPVWAAGTTSFSVACWCRYTSTVPPVYP
jgi:hypothetical protein